MTREEKILEIAKAIAPTAFCFEIELAKEMLEEGKDYKERFGRSPRQGFAFVVANFATAVIDELESQDVVNQQ